MKRYEVAREITGGPAEASVLTVTSKVASMLSNHGEKINTVNKLMAAHKRKKEDERNKESAKMQAKDVDEIGIRKTPKAA